MFSLSRPGSRRDKQVLVSRVMGCPLGPDLAESQAARRQSLQPQLQQLAGVGGLPPSSYGRHSHTLGPVQVMGLGYR